MLFEEWTLFIKIKKAKNYLEHYTKERVIRVLQKEVENRELYLDWHKDRVKFCCFKAIHNQYLKKIK